MFMVYQYVDGSLVPTFMVKPLRDFEIGEIYLCVEFGISGIEYTAYRVVKKTKIGRSISLMSERLEV